MKKEREVLTVMENVGKGTELAKRFCLDDVILKRDCDCGSEMSVDLGSNYLNYPVVGSEETIYMYCEECEAEHEEAMRVRIVINLEVLGEHV
jgi:hypothetical protein